MPFMPLDTPEALRRLAEQERSECVRAAQRLRAAGLPCPEVSVGSAPTALSAANLGGVTGVRAGVYVLFDLVMAFIFTLAVYEFVQLMKLGKFAPNLIFAVAFVWMLLLDAVLPRLNLSGPALALLLIAALTWQMRQRSGSPTANWALSVAGGIYLGVAGAHFILIRQLDGGQWWLLLALTGTWLADSGAYVIGRKFGAHKMTPAMAHGLTTEVWSTRKMIETVCGNDLPKC